jgi:ECF sigma factor
MSLDEMASVTRQFGGHIAGGHTVARQLSGRYFDRLVRLTRSKLLDAHRSNGAKDEEDAPLVAFDGFCRGTAFGRFRRLADRDHLWRLPGVLSVRKPIDQLERQDAARRGGSKVVGESSLPAAETDGQGLLPPRQVPRQQEGYEREEIAARLGCTVRTVTRKLDVIRQTWLREEVA